MLGMYGKAIQAARKRAGLTQTDLAERVGVQQGTVARWESGEIAAPMSRLRKIAEATGVALAEILDIAGQAAPPAPPATGLADPGRAFLPPTNTLPKDLPVLGSALAADLVIGENGESVAVERLELGLIDVIEYVRRPVAFIGNKNSYALYVQGSSMEPRFESGDLIYVDAKRPAAPGDDVVVQMRDATGHDGDDQVVSAMIKRLVRRSGTTIELRQYSPELRFILPMAKVAAVHRVVKLSELMGV
jgi:phage repressor protein C with HTH and peptisase S24 domain